MKPTAWLLVLALAAGGLASSLASAQSPIAQFMYEDAEQAFANGDFVTALERLDEAERTLGRVNPPILYLRIMARHERLKRAGDGGYDFTDLDLARADAASYLEAYGAVEALREQLRDVYRVSQQLRQYPATREVHEAMVRERQARERAAAAARDIRQQAGAGVVVRGWLGLQIQEVTSELALSLGLAQAQGALIADVLPDGPAARSGLRAGDVIVAYGEDALHVSSELPPLVGRTQPGTAVVLTIFRGGRHQTLTATIGQLPDETVVTAPVAGADRLGLVVAAEAQGIRVLEVRAGAAANAGLQGGDLILQIAGQPVASVATFQALVDGLPAGQAVLLRIQRDTPFFVSVAVPE